MRALLFGFPKRRIGRAEYFLRLFVGAILFLVLVMLDDRVGGGLAAKVVFIVGSLLLADWCWCTTGRLLDIGWPGWAAPLLVAIPAVICAIIWQRGILNWQAAFCLFVLTQIPIAGWAGGPSLKISN